ncbi:hypothetical protein GCM10023144_01620 [Pigmentiphaga soli]|uniref:Uncharacterized protein n=1 Tax=Pigmentiphaga soli TaxID=1007095 RepID=A0ABP8GDI1_9BURK
MFTKEQIDRAVQDAMPDVLAGLRKEIAEQAVYQAKVAVHASVQKAVTDWINENLVPDIMATLTESKAGILSAVPSIAQGIAKALGESLVASVTEKMERSYERRKIFDALLN